MSKHLLTAIAVVAVGTTAHADSFIPFTNFRQVDATGIFYVVVKRDDGMANDVGRRPGITFEYAKRRPDSPPVTKCSDFGGKRETRANPEVKVRDGDMILGRGKLDCLPQYTILSTTGLGFTFLAVYPPHFTDANSNDAVVIVDAEGKVQHRKSVSDLFNAEEQFRFSRRPGCMFWAQGGWYDERRREFVVVSSANGKEGNIPRLIRVIDLGTGAIRQGSDKEIMNALADNNRGALELALQLATELKIKESEKDLVRHFDDARLPTLQRIRAALALAALGDRRGATMMTKVALDMPGEDRQTRYVAITNLPHVLGDRAAPVLCDCVRKSEQEAEVTHFAWQAMKLVSAEAAVPELIKLLDEKGTRNRIAFCCDCLGRIGPEAKAAVPSLIKVLRDADLRHEVFSSTRELAAFSLGKIGPDAASALPELIRLAEMHAADEWKQVASLRPERKRDGFGGNKYSDNCFIDAIWKIRTK